MNLTVGVSYGEDLQKVKEVAMKVVADIPGLSPNDQTTIFYEAFDDSSIIFSIRLWAATPEQPDFLRVRSEAVMRIKKAFDENDIMILFPIRTLDFGIKGGQILREMPLTIARQNSHKNGSGDHLVENNKKA